MVFDDVSYGFPFICLDSATYLFFHAPEILAPALPPTTLLHLRSKSRRMRFEGQGFRNQEDIYLTAYHAMFRVVDLQANLSAFNLLSFFLVYFSMDLVYVSYSGLGRWTLVLIVDRYFNFSFLHIFSLDTITKSLLVKGFRYRNIIRSMCMVIM